VTSPYSSVRAFFLLLIAFVAMTGCSNMGASADSSIEGDSRHALQSLYNTSPGARSLGAQAKGILVFPNVLKAGLVVGAQGGDGVLLVDDKLVGHYNTSAVSVGMQAGGQSFGYVLFFMTDSALSEFLQSKNFQIGVGPNIVIVDAGMAKDVNTLTGKADVYAMIFNQKGLMAGIGLQGSKITKISK